MVLTRYSVAPVQSARPISATAARTVLSAMLIASGCALIVFALLVETRSSERSTQAASSRLASTAAVRAASTPQASQTSGPAAAQVDAAKQDDGAARTARPAGGLAFSDFTLVASRRFQRLGQFSVKLLRTDPRHGTFDLAVLVRGHTVNQRRVKVSQPIWIAAGDAKPSEIVVNKVSKGRVYGVLGDATQTGKEPARTASSELRASAAPE